MKKLNIIIILSIMVTLISSNCFASPVVVTTQDRVNGYVIVEKGWTLSNIAKEVFGDHNDYPKLVKFNNLINPNNVSIGQKIYIYERLTPEVKIQVASKIVKQHIQKLFKMRYGKEYPWDISKSWALAPMIPISEYSNTRYIRTCLQEAKVRLAWYDAVTIGEKIQIISKDVDDIFYITALIEAESNFRNVHGSAGEIGPCQIKPTTGHYIHKKYFDEVTVDEISEMLENVTMNVEYGYLLIKHFTKRYNQNKRKALEKYNAGRYKKQYARNILRKYNKLIKKFNNDVQNVY